MPTAAEALPGRDVRMPVPSAHFVNGNRLEAPFPEGFDVAMFGMGCFWGAERKFWQLDGVYSTAVGYAAGYTPNPTYREVCSGMTGHNEVVLVVFDPARISFDALLRTFWENHNPTQGMRQATTSAPQYRSGIYCYSEPSVPRRNVPVRLPVRLAQAGYGANHDRDRRRTRLLLCRGLSPAVPGQESGRILRSRRDGRRLPGGLVPQA